MESKLVPTSQSKTQEHSASDALIRQWLFRFGVEHKEDVAPRLPLWIEAFGGMDAAILERLFSRALKTCKFFPKVSEILEPLEKAKAATVPEAAQKAWEMVLEIRRTRWSPDAPGGFYGGRPQLSERIWQACRASGVFRDVETVNDLHVWARERFIESFLAWDDSEAGKYMLPDGEIKSLLSGAAQTKALPAPEVAQESYTEMRARGLAYMEQLKAAPAGDPNIKRAVRDIRQRACAPPRSLEEQKRILHDRGLLP